MPPKKDQKKQQLYKGGQLAKDILLPTIKQVPREAKQLRIPTVDPAVQQKMQAFRAQQQIDEWPGDEEAKSFNFGLDSHQTFTEKSKYSLPPSYCETSSQITFWQRMKMFVGDQQQQQQSQQKPKQSQYYYQSQKDQQQQQQGSPPEKYLRRGMTRKSMVVERDSGEKEATFLQRTGDDNDIEILSPLKKSKNIWDQEEALDESGAQAAAPPQINIKVFSEIERQETEDEREERRQRYFMEKEKASKEKKKQGKKEDIPFDESLIMRKEVKMSNIDLSGFVPVFSKWVGSQLQIIKDRAIKDANTGKPLYSKIFPQVDGFPVYNPSGRYWVKLYWMGKERKLEIDDKMPINARKICLFPRSAEPLEIWPMLFSKALLKLQMGGGQLTGNEIFSFEEVGDGSIMYALTGLVPETLNMQQLNPDNWKFLNEMLREQHFKNESAFLTTYCNSDYKPFAPSNQITTKKDAIFETMSFNEQTKFISASKKLQQQQMQAQQMQERLSEPEEQGSQQQVSTSIKEQKTMIQPKRNISNRKNSTIVTSSNLLFIGENAEETKALKIDTGKSIVRERPTYVIPGFAYSIIESFYNENFNMVYTKERSEKEMQLREEFFGMLKTNIHKMTREEKLEFRKRKKEIREMLHEEDKKRLELITKAPIQYKFLKIKTAASRIPLLNFVTPYSSKEIYIAQKCIINRLPKPPNYDLPEIRADDKSVMSLSVQPTQNAEQYIQKPLEDFGNPNAKEPQKRGNMGAWILDKDFVSVYQFVCIYHNLNKFQYQQVLQQQTFSDCELTKNEATEVLIIEPNDYAEMEQPEYFYSTKQSGIVFSFASLKPSNANNNLTPYLVFQKYDFEQFKEIESLKIINKQMDGFHYQFKNEPQIFRLFVNSPLGYNMWIGSTNKFSFLSVSELLTTKLGFESKVIAVEYPTLEKDKYFVLFKQKICGAQSKTILLFRIRIFQNCSDAYIFQYFRFKLVAIEDSQSNVMFNAIEGVHFNLQETSYSNTSQFNRVELEVDQNYILMMEGKCPYNMQDGNFEIEILYKNEENNLNIENIEMVAPVEYNDKYLPSKYGIIFRERLYVGSTACVSFFLRLAQIPQVQESKESRPATLKGKKSQEQIDIPEVEFSCKRLIKLELFQDENLIVYSYGFNCAYISNVFLMSTKENIGQGMLGSQPQSQHSQKGHQKQHDKSIERDDRYRNYYLQASFDLRDWPECKTLNEETRDLIWVLRTFSSESIIMMRDTSKEDAEKELKKSWEDREPGRAERAKKARKKYFLQLKRDRGEELTPQEVELLNEPRLTKRQREEEQKLAGAKGKQAAGKAPPAKAPAKGKKGQQDESSLEIKERELPLSTSHNMQEIKAFLEHMEQQRLMIEEPEHGGQVDIRSTENVSSIEESLKMAKEEFKNLHERNQERREEIRSLQEKRKQDYIQAIEQQRQDYKTELNEILAERELIKSQQTSKKEKERAIIALCQQEKPNQGDLEKAISEQTEDVDQRLIQIAEKVLTNIKISSVIEKLEQSVGQFELDQIEEAVGIIEEWSIQVDENLLKTAYEIIDEASNNPDYIQQKQAELKKVSKKPGKR